MCSGVRAFTKSYLFRAPPASACFISGGQSRYNKWLKYFGKTAQPEGPPWTLKDVDFEQDGADVVVPV